MATGGVNLLHKLKRHKSGLRLGAAIVFGTTFALAFGGCQSKDSAPVAVVQTLQDNFTIAGQSPNLAAGQNGGVVLSYLTSDGATHTLNFALFDKNGWHAPRQVASGVNWFVNWADFPSVVPVNEKYWAAHWLVRRAAGGYAYDTYVATSADAGNSWSEPFLLHDDGTDTEHGFVTLFPSHGNAGAVWLDGRNMAAPNGLGQPVEPIGMTLRAGAIERNGAVVGETIIDSLTCDCCQTDVTVTSAGPVAVYRDRTNKEIRDIYAARFVDGKWQTGQPVHHDGWRIDGCPVNGPAIDSQAGALVVAWFTAADNVPLLNIAWSDDDAASFASPIVVAKHNVLGFAGTVMLNSSSAVVSWLCPAGTDQRQICYRAADSQGLLGVTRALEGSHQPSRLGVPQLQRAEDKLMFAWTSKSAQSDEDDSRSLIVTQAIPIIDLIADLDVAGASANRR